MMFRGHEPGENFQAAVRDDEIMETAAIDGSADLADKQTPPLRAEVRRYLLERHHAMGQTLDVGAGIVCGPIIKEQRGAVSPSEILFEGEDLPAVAQRGLREQPELGKGIEGNSRRSHSVHGLEEQFGRFVQLHFGWMKKGVLPFERKLFIDRGQLHDLHPIQRPAVGVCDFFDFVACFRQADVEDFFTGLRSRQKELQRERRLARAGRSLDKKNSATRQAASEHIVQSGDSSGAFIVAGQLLLLHSRLNVSTVWGNTRKIGNPRKNCRRDGLVALADKMPVLLSAMLKGFEINMVVPDLWQQEAVHALRDGKDVVVQAPTGSGKTFIFELLYPSLKGQAIFTVPTRALANDKLAEWRARGWDVGIATGDLALNLNARVLVATLETQRARFLRRDGPQLLVVD